MVSRPKKEIHISIISLFVYIHKQMEARMGTDGTRVLLCILWGCSFLFSHHGIIKYSPRTSQTLKYKVQIRHVITLLFSLIYNRICVYVTRTKYIHYISRVPHRVCPLVPIGTPPHPPLPQASVSLPPEPKAGNTLACG